MTDYSPTEIVDMIGIMPLIIMLEKQLVNIEIDIQIDDIPIIK